MFTCSGGESALAADAAAVAGLELRPPSAEATATIAAELPWYAGVGNPLDYNTALWGLEEPLLRVFGAALADGADVALLVIDHPRHELGLTGEIDAAISALERSAAAAGVPAAVASTIPESFPADRAGCRSTRAVWRRCRACRRRCSALGACAAWGERRRAPLAVTAGAAGRRRGRAARRGGVEAPDRRRRGRAARGAAGRARTTPSPRPSELGFPVVVKLCSPDLPHKADAGAVAVGLATRRRRGTRPSRQMLARNAGVALSGVLVERMVRGRRWRSCWSG